MDSRKSSPSRKTVNQNRFGIRAYCAVECCPNLIQSFGVCKPHYDYIRSANISDRIAESRKAQYQRTKTTVKIKNKKWAAANAAKVRKYKSAWKKRNRGYVKAATMKRYADKKKATPPWSDLKEIQKIYDACPPGHHVDHIIPLRGKTVCGLHVPWNLQHLPAIENIRKGNRYEAA